MTVMMNSDLTKHVRKLLDLFTQAAQIAAIGECQLLDGATDYAAEFNRIFDETDQSFVEYKESLLHVVGWHPDARRFVERYEWKVERG